MYVLIRTNSIETNSRLFLFWRLISW